MKRASCFTLICLYSGLSFTFIGSIANGVSYAYVAPIEQKNLADNDNYTIHIVENGDNLYRIGLKYKVAQKDIIELNNISNNHIFVGQKLKIPVKNEDNPVKVNEKENTKNDNNITENKKQDIKKENKSENESENNNSATVNPNLNKVVKTSNISIQDKNIVNQIEPTTFIWPARGVVLSHFGHLTRTGRLEGINIGGENGSLVKASASGKVVYNDKVDGFGNVILVQHYNGFITAYGYTDPLVATGDRVKKGQVIAYMTNNKQSKRSMLYFSIRKNGKCYDPEKVIATKISN